MVLCSPLRWVEEEVGAPPEYSVFTCIIEIAAVVHRYHRSMEAFASTVTEQSRRGGADQLYIQMRQGLPTVLAQCTETMASHGHDGRRTSSVV